MYASCSYWPAGGAVARFRVSTGERDAMWRREREGSRAKRTREVGWLADENGKRKERERGDEAEKGAV